MHSISSYGILLRRCIAGQLLGEDHLLQARYTYKSGIENGVLRIMSEVKVNPGDSFEGALKKFNRKVQQDGILSEARRRAFYESPQARRKRKAAAHLRKLRRAAARHSRS